MVPRKASWQGRLDLSLRRGESRHRAHCPFLIPAACLQVQVGEGGTRILGLELNNSGRRLMVTAADHHIRIFLLHRPGDRQPLREQQRLARAMCSSAANGAWSSTTASQAKAQAPGDWRVRNMEEARRAVATTATLSRSRNSVFYDNDAAWLTGLLDFAHENARRQWKCAAFSPGARLLRRLRELVPQFPLPACHLTMS